MKIYHIRMKGLAVLWVALALLSCDKDLDVEPRDNISEIDFLNNDQNATALVNGVYNAMLDWKMYSFSWIGMTSMTSDDADKGSTPGDTGTDKHKLDALNFDSSMVSLKEVWDAHYEGIYRANSALYYLEQLSINQNLKNRLIGEVKFLRALWYFDLVRCFGGVPVVVQKIELNNTALVNQLVNHRKTKEETYAQIEADLLSAIELLPNAAQYTSDDKGRASKGAAQGLLAKVYLYQEKWQQSYDMSLQVTGYSLLTNYADVWREVSENGSESLFEVQSTLGKGVQGYTDVQSPRGTPDLGWGFNTPTMKLVNTYEPGDLRKNATIMFVTSTPFTLWDGYQGSPTWNNPRYNYKAYQSSLAESWNGNKSETAKNIRILKYSDLLLIRAEAGYHIGNSAVALEIINDLRHRAGLADLNTIDLPAIYKERHLEMAMEHERWFDIIRTGQAVSAMAADGKTFIPGVHEVFPIPYNAILQSNFQLTQNNGY
ncbi:RagB/SusD family nutrient uptake outer membrane protein [Flavobacterium sp. CYK-55]|uniref:RagB/SusD family nutrient uptake outer membrane protein n=1 Tax=Flavobacterium sp. CYK-55 TaxID=2835529 RepID=UPI001BD03009|nr:RagB/SusD family nutrient uptake outer membrane protein [Flavobacterium sp. CYK-55]MBS7788160.1 RagB/SusD family nutrient uptake outer membrane protein [Flavobacterium sp. CYK-55]